MIRSAKELLGHQLAAHDGHIGHIKDFYFDDALWVVRYLIADTGSWLTGRLVLISPLAFGEFDDREKALRVSLTRKQIENSPSIDSHLPISRRYEQEYYQYYNWPYYWQGGALWGISDFPTVPPMPIIAPPKRTDAKTPMEDKHLRSVNSVLGYRANAVDKDVGTIADFLIDDRTWIVTGIAIDTGHWLPGRKVVVAAGQIGHISWNESTVTLKTTSAALERAPALEAVTK